MNTPRFVFRQLFDHSSFTFTYILGSTSHKQAVIIDPVVERIPLYARLSKELGLTLVKCLDTHIHADHVSANGSLRDQFGCSITMPKESPVSDVVSIKIEDGDDIEVCEDLKLKAIYTPGHTSDSYSYYVGPNIIPGCNSGALFTGDTLFIRGTGRTDFQHGDPGKLYDSIFEKLLKYSGDTVVFPAHDYKGESCSTLAEEIEYNPRLILGKEKGRDAFIDHMNNLKLANPKLMDVAVPSNLKLGLECPKLQQDIRNKGLAYTANEAALEIIKADTAIIDIRDDCEIKKHGNIESKHSFHFLFGNLLQSGPEDIRSIAKNYSQVILYCTFGERSSLILNKCHEVGINNVKHLQGGICAWKEFQDEGLS